MDWLYWHFGTKVHRGICRCTSRDNRLASAFDRRSCGVKTASERAQKRLFFAPFEKHCFPSTWVGGTGFIDSLFDSHWRKSYEGVKQICFWGKRSKYLQDLSEIQVFLSFLKGSLSECSALLVEIVRSSAHFLGKQILTVEAFEASLEKWRSCLAVQSATVCSSFAIRHWLHYITILHKLPEKQSKHLLHKTCEMWWEYCHRLENTNTFSRLFGVFLGSSLCHFRRLLKSALR